MDIMKALAGILGMLLTFAIIDDFFEIKRLRERVKNIEDFLAKIYGKD